MRILVIGSGGREHALVWKLSQSPLVSEIIAAPGNGGTTLDGVRSVDVNPADIPALVRLAREEKVDLVVPGPELPLTLGITDAMFAGGVPCFGPDRYCAQLEGSKYFAKEIMGRAGVPTAACAVFDDANAAKNFIEKKGGPLVVKADGLAAGKGVVVAKTTQEALAAVESIMQAHEFGAAGNRIVIEECLQGEEVSLLCLCDGVHAVPLSSAQDHKAACDNDQGPNTGGMGAYSPAPILPDSELEAMTDLVIRPILKELAKENHPFIGILYAGLMITEKGPRVLEYNVRFGDPECQPLLMRLNSDLVKIMLACIAGQLTSSLVSFTPRPALGIVLASSGYPAKYQKGMPITGITDAESHPDLKVFHSGTKSTPSALLSNGGRVLCVTALGDTLQSARETAYAGVGKIAMPNSFYRTDIGMKGIRRLSKMKSQHQEG